MSEDEAIYFTEWITKIRPALLGRRVTKRILVKAWLGNKMSKPECDAIACLEMDSSEFLDQIFLRSGRE